MSLERPTKFQVKLVISPKRPTKSGSLKVALAGQTCLYSGHQDDNAAHQQRLELMLCPKAAGGLIGWDLISLGNSILLSFKGKSLKHSRQEMRQKPMKNAADNKLTTQQDQMIRGIEYFSNLQNRPFSQGFLTSLMVRPTLPNQHKGKHKSSW